MLRFTTEPVAAKDLKPGDLFNSTDAGHMAGMLKTRPTSLGLKILVRTDARLTPENEDTKVFKVTIHTGSEQPIPAAATDPENLVDPQEQPKYDYPESLVLIPNQSTLKPGMKHWMLNLPFLLSHVRTLKGAARKRKQEADDVEHHAKKLLLERLLDIGYVKGAKLRVRNGSEFAKAGTIYEITKTGSVKEGEPFLGGTIIATLADNREGHNQGQQRVKLTEEWIAGETYFFAFEHFEIIRAEEVKPKAAHPLCPDQRHDDQDGE